MTDIRVPKLNNNDTRYVLVEWLAKDGERVSGGDALAVLETSKAAEEIVAEEGGVLRRLLDEGGDCVPGQVIARLHATGEEHAREAAPGPGADAPVMDGITPPGIVVTAPARDLARELGVGDDLLRALGKKIIRSEDVRRLAAGEGRANPGPVPAGHTGAEPEGTPGPAPARHADAEAGEAPGPAQERHADRGEGPREEAGDGEVVALSRAQRLTGDVVARSHQTIPAAFTAVKVDAGPALASGRVLTRRERALIGLPELLVKAVAGLREEFPLFFASLVAPGRVRHAAGAHVGVTIDLGEGLFVPVVRDADRKTLGEIGRELTAFKMTALTGRFREDDLSGAAIVVTLHTDEAVTFAVPIVFPGHTCALSLTSPQPEVVATRDGYTTRQIVHLGVAFDHRVVNGRDAALFLGALKRALETPTTPTLGDT
ncbi:2-oxo acid dehydrogenase subunit E2 [Microbispora sp. NPDC049125]|uniref:2-oxo acid dehydrogenase subunit E2 n=1 Tax=Microbispora sp. NPDC049125 TaxID=3154929 RepID=UPI003465BF93